MNRKSEVALTILLACLTVAVFMATEPAPAPADQDPPTQEEGRQHDTDQQQVAGKSEFDHSPGPGPFKPVFLIVYLRKDGDWGKNDCITVFPDTAEVSLTKKPKKVIWVVLDKDEYHQWDITPKTAGDERVPPLAKIIGKGKDKNAFWSGPPSSQGVPYTWGYSIKLTEVDGEGDPTGNKCKKDPGVEVRG